VKLRQVLRAPLRAVEIDRHGRRPLGDGRFDVIVVPGCTVREDGTASGALRRRVGLGVSLWRQRRAPILVFSGRGRGGRVEADVMGEIALGSGVPARAIELERQAMNTADNARLCREMLGVDRVLIATDFSHVLRCEREFGRWFDIARGAGVPLSSRSRVRMALMEALRECWADR